MEPIKYHTYTTSCEEATKAYLKRHYSNKADRKKAGMKETLYFLATNFPGFFGSMDGKLTVEEWMWLTNGRRTIFPATAETLDMINRAHIELVTGQGIIPPFKPFAIATPKTFKMLDLPCKAILVSVFDIQERLANFMNFCRYIGYPEHVFQKIYEREKTWSGDDKENVTICVSYRSAIDDKVTRLSINMVDLPAVLATKNVAEFMSVVSEAPGFSHHIKGTVEHAEIDQQRVVLHLVIRALIYMQAANCLESGLPASFTEDDSGLMYSDFQGEPKSNILRLAHAPQTGIERNAHYRSFFIRQLRAERFYQGEHEGKVPGSRFVFVKDTYVGAKTDAYTLNEETDQKAPAS